MLGVSQELEKCPLDGILPLENLQQWNLAFPTNRSQTSLNGSSQDEKCQQ
jgi:hypothetical protein